MNSENYNLQAMEAKLSEWRLKIDELEEKAALTAEKKKTGFNPQLKRLRQRYLDLEDRLARLKTSARQDMEEGREGVEKSWKDFIDAFEKTAAMIK